MEKVPQTQSSTSSQANQPVKWNDIVNSIINNKAGSGKIVEVFHRYSI